MTEQESTTKQNLELPWVLPEQWEWVPLGVLCKMINGRAFKKSEWSDSGLPIIRIQNLNDETKPFNYFDGEFDSKHFVRDGDVLISWSGTPGTSFGAFIWNRGEALLNQHIYRIETEKTEVLNKYFAYSVNARLEELIRRATGGVGLRHITKKELQKLLLPIPFRKSKKRSIEAQKNIVVRIESLIFEIKEARKLIEKMRRDAERLLRSAYEETFERVKERARSVTLKDVATAENGRASGVGESNIRVFKTRHVYPHFLLLSDPFYVKEEQVKKLPEDRFIRPGDVLMANIAEGTLGRVTFVNVVDKNWTVDTQIMILRSKDQNNVLLGKWLYYYLWSPRGQEEILSRRSGIAFADKRGQTHIYPKNVREIPIPLPDINIQRMEVTHLDGILCESQSLQTDIERHLTMLDKLEQSILERALRGEL